MFDIGLGEFVGLAVIALLVFGPDRLPRYAAQAGQWLRELRGMTEKARQELTDAMGSDVADAAFDPKGSLKRALGVDGLTVEGLTADPAEPKPAGDRRYDPDAT